MKIYEIELSGTIIIEAESETEGRHRTATDPSNASDATQSPHRPRHLGYERVFCHHQRAESHRPTWA